MLPRWHFSQGQPSRPGHACSQVGLRRRGMIRTCQQRGTSLGAAYPPSNPSATTCAGASTLRPESRMREGLKVWHNITFQGWMNPPPSPGAEAWSSPWRNWTKYLHMSVFCFLTAPGTPTHHAHAHDRPLYSGPVDDPPGTSGLCGLIERVEKASY
jgi:hypothetical protein